MRKTFFFIALAYLLVAMQTSLLPHASIAGFTIPLAAIFALALSFVENPAGHRAFFVAFAGGLFIDTYSDYIFGFFAVTLLFLVFCIKFILKNYVRFAAR